MKYLIITSLLIILTSAFNVTFIGNISNDWSICNNWSTNKCPDTNDTVIINNKYVFMNEPFYNHLNNLLLYNNSKLLISNVYINISNHLVNQNSTLIIENSTIYLWNNNTTTKTGNLYMYNTNFVPNGDIIFDTFVLLSGSILLPTNIHIYGLLEFLPNTQLLMGDSFNITQYKSSTIIIYGFPSTKEYLQQYIFMCYMANMNGNLYVNFDGSIGNKKETFWFFIVPSIMQNNHYNFTVTSYNYNVSLKRIVGDTLMITLKDLI